MGVVYKAEDTKLGRQATVKLQAGAALLAGLPVKPVARPGNCRSRLGCVSHKIGGMGIDEGLVQQIVGRVLSVAKPDRIILFGSAAIGRMTRDSDIDLLVLEAAPESRLKESVKIRRALAELDYAFDVIVMRTERFEETKAIIGGLAFPANKYGRVIYEAA
jgi:predicted nucleotidyltransferase